MNDGGFNIKQLFISISGWIPAVILPAAALVQLIKIIIAKDVRGISIITWLMFGLANIGLYFFTEKYFYIQSLLGLLFTALIDFIIVGLIVYYKRRTAGE